MLVVLHGDEQLLRDAFQLLHILLGKVVQVGNDHLLLAASSIKVALDLFVDFLMDLRVSL